jgi:hypothetical protein
VPAIYRAPMRSRDLDAPAGAGAAHGLEHGLVGIGGALPVPAATIDEAVAAARDTHGDKTGRMLRGFADLPEGTLIWTRTNDGAYHLGQISGPWRYDGSPAARAVGIHHVRPATWLERSFPEDEVPAGVARTFARGGRNFQRTHDQEAERMSADLWRALAVR